MGFLSSSPSPAYRNGRLGTPDRRPTSLLNEGGRNLLQMSCMHNVHIGHEPTWVDLTERGMFPSPSSMVEGSIPQLHNDRASTEKALNWRRRWPEAVKSVIQRFQKDRLLNETHRAAS